MIQFTTAVWADLLAQSTAAGRATALAGKNPDTLELLDASGAVIRTIALGSWTVNGAYAVPGTYADSALGGGTPAVAVFKAGATEIMRMTCGTLAGADYRLLANIVAGVPIRRGPFAVLFLPPPEPGTSQPSVVTAPTISGVAQVGQVLTATPGTYTGNPAPTVTRRWKAGAAEIAGATGLALTLGSGQLGAIITFEEVVTNSVGSVVAASNALGPVAAAALNADAVPATIQIDQGGTFDLTPYVTGGVPPYTAAVAVGYSLPTGVTQTGPMELSAAIDAPLTGEPLPTVKFDIDDSAVAATLPTFGVLSSVGGADLPFAFGHVFKQGDVPSGSYVDSDLTDWQCVPTTYWPDGSLRHAIIAGRATCTQNVRKDITLSVSGTDRTGAALTETDLAAALTTATIQGGSHETALASLIGTSALHRTVCTGPIMSNWIYRHPVTSSNHLVIWIDVRLYKGGRIEIFPWVENAYLTVANPTNDVRTWTVTIGGTQVFSQSIDIKHHTRIPLISGSSFSYWTTDPGIVPVHDTAYMMASKMVPNYGWTSPSESTLNGGNSSFPVTQTYTPNWIGNGSTGMDITGWQPRIGVHPGNMALYLTSGADARAYRSMIANGLAGGSWSIHARDNTNTTNPNEPVIFSAQPTLWMQSLSSGGAGTGGTNGSITAAAAHQPQYAMLPWLVTGRWWFLDEALMWVAANYLWQAPSNRGNADGVYLSHTNNETRGAAWAIMHLAHACAITPSTHPAYSSLIASLNANVVAYHSRYIAGTLNSGTFVNDLGVLGHYSSSGSSSYVSVNAWFVAPWQEAYMSLAWGEAVNMNLPITDTAKLEAVRNFAFKFPVGMFGDGSAGNANWRRASAYQWPVGTDSIGWPPDNWYTDFGQAYSAYCTEYGLNASAPATEGLAFFDNESDNATPSDGSDFTTSFLGMTRSALVYAAEAGATGAAAAMARVNASSSAALMTNYNNTPTWGIAPRSA